MTLLVDEPEQVVTTPTLRRSGRRALFWVIVAVLLVLIYLAYTAVAPPSLSSDPLSPTSTGQTGSKALVQVLEAHGVSVTSTTSLATTENAISDPNATTVLMYDPSDYLDPSQLRQLSGLAAHVVIVAPDKTQLSQIDPSVSLVGTAAPTPTPQCSLPAARKAGQIADSGQAYRVAAGAPGYTTCYPSGDNDYTLVQHRDSSGTLTIVGALNAFTNRYIVDAGNAALAINLLGGTRNLVWYLPSLTDLAGGSGTESFASAAPAWLSWIAVLALLVVIAAAVWRGRRFGPLVVERMPVFVRSSETMEGRARLYQTTSARLRALDALRIGSVTRIRSYCGLPRTADVEQVVTTAASTTGRPVDEVRGILLGGIPHSDRELVRQSDALVELENAVAKATGAAPPPTDTSRTSQKEREPDGR